MRSLLFVSGILLVVLAGHLALRVLRRTDELRPGRERQLLVLAAPVTALGLGLCGLDHLGDRTCFLGVPSWSFALGVLLPLGMGLVGLGGLALGLVRLALMDRVVGRRGTPAAPELQTLADHLADRLGTSRPRVRLFVYQRPLALAVGLSRPTILISSWIVENLDPRELEALLCHELGHVVRHDYLVIWLATVLRDAFCYLPTSWTAYRQLQHEKEFACDELAVGATGRPLALASALVKVWHYAAGGPVLQPTQPLVGVGASIERRVERLLAIPRPVVGKPRSCLVACSIAASSLVGLLFFEAAGAVISFAPVACGPIWSLGKPF